MDTNFQCILYLVQNWMRPEHFANSDPDHGPDPDPDHGPDPDPDHGPDPDLPIY